MPLMCTLVFKPFMLAAVACMLLLGHQWPRPYADGMEIHSGEVADRIGIIGIHLPSPEVFWSNQLLP